jgi:WD40 repeat protein
MASTGDWKVLRLWDIASGRELWSEPFGGLRIGWIAFSPNSRTVAAGTSGQSTENVIRLFNAESGEELHRFDKGRSETLAVAFSPDGKLFAAGGLHKVIEIWDAATYRLVRQIDHGTNGAISLRFSPDGTRLACVDYDDFFRMWDVATGKSLPDLRTERRNFDFAFAPDGRTMLSYGDNVGQLWDLTARKVLFVLEEQDQATAAFSPDGRVIASLGRQGKFCLWEAATGSKLGEFPGHFGSAGEVRFSADGTRLLSACIDRTLLVWDVRALLDRKTPAEPVRSEKEVAELWEVLGRRDARQANRALARLSASRKLFLPFVSDRLWSTAHQETIGLLIRALDDEDFDIRERAVRDLQKWDDLAEPALRQALASKPSAEAKRHIRGLLDRFDSLVCSALEGARAVRLVEALEETGDLQARELLQRAARDFPATRLGREATAALGRLAR